MPAQGSEGVRPAQNGHEAPRYIRRADGGTSMMREGIVSLWSRLCASNLRAVQVLPSDIRNREGIPESPRGWQRSSSATLPVTASECKVVSLPVWCSALEDLYGREIVPFLRDANSICQRGCNSRERSRALTLMSSMKRRTLSSSRTEGIGRLMTFIGTCTVGRSHVANFEKLTKGRGAVLAGESCEGPWSMTSSWASWWCEWRWLVLHSIVVAEGNALLA